ncbi:MAG: D-alanine--D-alanine ligase A [Candidatus Chloroheliales bacterium]|nr:MAG: D-alanine--D-alanine ligase A [Chloroflexota bacterium]
MTEDQQPNKKIRVGVIFGGRSAEHEVSLESARNIMAALDSDRYEALPIGISKEGRWLIGAEAMPQLQAAADSGAISPAFLSAAQPAAVLGPSAGRALVEITASGSANIGQAIDVFFPVLHGPYGEDGTVQGLLELADVPYVGAGVLGSALGMDKAAMKDVFAAQGLPVVPHIVVRRSDWRDDPDLVLEALAATGLEYPLFVKPANMGSSVGISKAHQADELGPSIELAAQYDRRIIVEQGIDAQEVECAVLGNDEPEASMVGEVVAGNEFYDYNAKYIDDNSDLIIPARLDEDTAERVQELAVQAFQAIDGAGMARVDFFVERSSGEVYVNEINTIPGFTRISMYPKLWEASGLSYRELVERLIGLAIERHEDRANNRIAR